MKDALIIGASGQVGASIAEALGKGSWRGTFKDRPFEGGIPADLEEIAESQQVASGVIATGDYTLVIVCAGMTNVDRCEADPETAFRCNRDAPARLARASREAGSKTVYLSTDYVFGGGGAIGPYVETDPPYPLNTYGKSKLEGERAVIREDPEALIIRTTVVYGPELQGKNFAYQVKRAIEEGTGITVASDQISTPTYNRDLAAAVLALTKQPVNGAVNIVGDELLGRADFAVRLVNFLGGETSLVRFAGTRMLKQAAMRPLQAGLKTDKLKSLLPNLTMRTIDESLVHWSANQRGEVF